MKRGSGPSQRTYVWTDRKNFKRYACFKTRNGTGIWLAVFRGKVCPLGCSEKVCIPSPFLRSCQKLGGGGRSHFHVNNSLLVIPFLVFLMLHEDRFCGFVLVTHAFDMRSTYIEECCFSSWPETSCLYVQSSLRTDLWQWILHVVGIPHCQSVGGGWGSTSTFLQTLLSDVRRFRMPSCLCATLAPPPPSYMIGCGWP